MSFIEFQDVTYTYPLTKTPALHDVNYSFEKGKFYGIIGPNGGGKTTLCSLAKGLIPHFYLGDLKGKAIIDGKDVRKWDSEELSTKIGFIFQNPFSQISGVKDTVLEEIAIGLENIGMPRKDMIDKVVDIARLLGVEHLLDKNPNKLSGGQCQRVAFASIIAMDNELLIIDEPTSQLDPEGTADVFNIIGKLKEEGRTVILVEHKVDLMAEYCDEIIVMQEGTIARSGPAQEIFSDESLLELGGAIPQAAILSHAMARAGKPFDHIAITKGDAIDMIHKRGGAQ